MKRRRSSLSHENVLTKVELFNRVFPQQLSTLPMKQCWTLCLHTQDLTALKYTAQPWPVCGQASGRVQSSCMFLEACIIYSLYCCHYRPCWDQTLLWTYIHWRNKSSPKSLTLSISNRPGLMESVFLLEQSVGLRKKKSPFSFFWPDSYLQSYKNYYTESNQVRK